MPRTFKAILCVAAAALAVLPARAEVEIDSSTFGGIEARSIGPANMSGRISALDAVGPDPLTIYIGAASGGVWKSTDGGLTTSPIFDDHVQSIGAIAIDPKNPKTVWVGTGESWTRNSISVGDGLYKSADGGDSWQRVGLEHSERIARVQVSPADGNTVWACATGHLWNSHEERGVFKTTDGGKTWKKVLYVDADTGCSDLAVDPQDPSILYAGMWQFRRTPHSFSSGGKGSGFYKSTDGGDTWRQVKTGLPEGQKGRIAVAVAPSRPSVLYALVESADTALFRSDDTGESWRQVNSSFNVQVRPFYFARLAVDPKDHNTVYKPGLMLTVSRDGGKSFNSAFGFNYGAGPHSDHHALWINPENPSELLLGTDGGVYMSYSQGRQWRHLKSLPVSQFYHVSHDMARPYRVYGGLQDNGTWSGPSAGLGGTIQNRDWWNIGGGDGFWAFTDPRDADLVFVEYQGGEISRRRISTGEEKVHQAAAGCGRAGLPVQLEHADSHEPQRAGDDVHGSAVPLPFAGWGRLLAAHLSGPDDQRSKEAAAEKLGRPLGRQLVGREPHHDLCHQRVAQKRPGDLGGDGRRQPSGDPGRRRQVDQRGGQRARPAQGDLGVERGGRTLRGGDGVRHLRRPRDGRHEDLRLPDGRLRPDLAAAYDGPMSAMSSYAHVVKQDLVNPDLLFVGTEFGLFISVDGGSRWARFTGKLPQVAVRDLAIHPREGDLLIATHGRGVYIVDDLSPLRKLTREALESDVAMLPSRTAFMAIPASVQDFPGDDEFVAFNPEESATITYYLKKRHLLGDLKVEVYDSSGKLLSTLPGGKRRGINRVAWPMRLAPPKLPPANSLVIGSQFTMLGPRVLPGSYTVKLIQGDKTYTSQVEILPDPRSTHSPEDRAAQNETVTALYGMLGRLTYLADSVKSLEDGARERAGKLPPADRLRRQLDSLAGTLESFRSTLVATGPGGWLSGDEQLREKIAKVYGGVNGYDGRPTQAQAGQVKVLGDQLEKAEARLEALKNGEVAAANRELEKRKLDPLKARSLEEWEKEDGKRAAYLPAFLPFPFLFALN